MPQSQLGNESGYDMNEYENAPYETAAHANETATHAPNYSAYDQLASQYGLPPGRTGAATNTAAYTEL